MENAEIISSRGAGVPKTRMKHVRPMRGRFTHERVDGLLQEIYEPDEYARMKESGVDKRMMFGTNAHYQDWAELSDEDYEASKLDLIETTLNAVEKYLPNIRERLAHVEASTPRTFRHYTQHVAGASFGTKFEGLAISRSLPDQIKGMYHAGSVGIIMSGWLGAINYGVIVANDVDSMLMAAATNNRSPSA